MPLNDFDEQIFGGDGETPNNPENQAYWKKRLKGQGELKATPPRSAWRRVMDNIYHTINEHGPFPILADTVAPLVETGEGKSVSQRRKDNAQKRRQRREDFQALDPADSPGDYVADAVGGLIGSVVSDPTNWIGGGAKTLGGKIFQGAGIGAGADLAQQGAEVASGVRDELDPYQASINLVASPAFELGAAGVKKGVQAGAKAIARPPKTLDLDTAVGIGNKFGTVTSTRRSAAKNKQVGGAKNSHHLYGRAIDIARGKGVTHKQIERAYRRAGYDIIESLDEGDHSHLVFNFKGSKAPEVQGPDDLGEVKLVRNELPSPEEMRRVNEGLSPQDQEAADNIIQMAQRDPVADQAPPIDSYHERFTPYVDEPNRPLNDALPESDAEFLARMDDPSRGMNETDVARLQELMNPEKGPTNSILDDVLTPAERQEMDASAVRPDVEPITPKPLGGGKSGDPANDVGVHDISDRFVPPELRGFHADMTKEIGKRAQKREFMGAAYHESGKLPMKIHDKFTTQKGGEPWMVIGHYVDPRNPNRYGYTVERGKGENIERQNLLVSDPDADIRMKRHNPNWDRAKHVSEWRKLTDNRKAGLKIVKDIIDDESGAFRPFGRDPVTNERVPFEQLEPETRLTQLLKRLKPMAGEQKKLYAQERAKRGSSLGNLQKGNFSMDNFRQQAAALRGQLPKTEYESIAKYFSDADLTALGNKINHSPVLLQHEKFRAANALVNLIRGEGATKLPTPGDIKLLSEVYSKDFIKALLDNRSAMSKVWAGTKNALNIPRAIMSSMDFSAPFRQGIGLVHKKEFWKSLPHMFKMWADTFSGGNAYKAWIADVKSSPRWKAAKEAGLAITDPHTHFLADREEDFMSDWAEKIPVAGKFIEASNSAYSGFLNKLRWDTFNNLVDQLEGMGEVVDEKKLKELGKFINMATGRGDLKFGDAIDLNAAAPAMSALLFSPRLMASRVKTLASPITYIKASPQVRKEAWKSLFSQSAYYMTLGGIAKYALGMDVETDPRHPDFMKAKIGNTRYDFMAGYGQYIRLGAQLISNSKVTSKGEERELQGGRNGKIEDAGPYDESLADVIGRFGRGKESPVASFIHDYLAGEDILGEPFELKKAAASRMLPMASQDIADAIQEWGAVGGPMGLPGLGGWSVQTYDANKPKDKPVKKDKDLEGFDVKEFESSGDDFDMKEWQ